MNDRNQSTPPVTSRTDADSQDASNDPSGAQRTEVAPVVPPASETPSEPSSEVGSHTYHEVAAGVEGRATTERERNARNKLAAAQDEMDAERGGQ